MLRSNFNYAYKMLDDGSRVGVVIDNNRPDRMSVTNDIENISIALNVDRIIYLDSEKVWTYWDRHKGYLPLVAKDDKGGFINAPTLDIAWKIAMSKYIEVKA